MNNFDFKKYLAKGKLLKENMTLFIKPETGFVSLEGEKKNGLQRTFNSHDIEDGKVSFNDTYRRGDIRMQTDGAYYKFNEDDWKEILGFNGEEHPFVKLVELIPSTEVEVNPYSLKVTVDLEELKKITNVELYEGKIYNEQVDFEAGHSDRLKELADKIDFLLYDEYHADIYMNDNIKSAWKALLAAIIDEEINPTI